MLKINNITS